MIIKKVKDNLLHLNNLRKFLGYEAFRSAMDSEFKLEILKNPLKGKVLVISPHPDDDIFGCGGTLKLHVNQGDNIKIIYITSTPKREIEAQKAAAKLGINDLGFWRYKDNQISANKTAINLLETVLNEFKPGIIYTPSFLDPNPDHFKTSRLLYNALHKHEFSGQIYSYEVWSPIYANRLIDIDKTIEVKKEALKKHASQLEDRNYLDAMTGLAQYRAGMFNAGKYAEGFFACNKELYIKLFELLLKK
ncbi:MAG: PIG-L family deacetylase [Patescibacteria group bacterium]|nr:PIG-L family deacetylase [Patescibacteria group bacterium]